MRRRELITLIGGAVASPLQFERGEFGLEPTKFIRRRQE